MFWNHAPQQVGPWLSRQVNTLLVLLAMLAMRGSAQDAQRPEKLEFFESKIRPVLVEHCYKCHSDEATTNSQLKGGLRVDSRDGLLAGGDSGPALKPGDASASLILSALKYDAFDMPPSGKLPDAVIQDFETWIAAGAADPRDSPLHAPSKSFDIEAGKKFWSFQPLSVSDLPIETSETPNEHPVDTFIRAAQRQRGLTHSPTADARTLIRRAWFDLIGLPPTPQELSDWMSRLTPSPNDSTTIDPIAWHSMLDSLLERPEYGERWARHWIDIARFAESFGYEQDYDRPTAYHYRDFLIRAFNSDLPYDRFVQWQIAGDELAPDDPLAWMATGFLGAGAFPTQLTETEFESARYNELDDMTATTGVAFLGLSIGCARCHDHKFDPIAAEDYYRFTAAFTHAIRSEKPFDLNPIGNQKRREQFEIALADARAELEAYESNTLGEQFFGYLKSLDVQPAANRSWWVLNGSVSSSGGTGYAPQSDGSFLASGNAPDQEVVTFLCEPVVSHARWLRIEALSDPSLPNRGPGRASNGNFALGDIRVEIIDRNTAADAAPELVSLTQPLATHQQNSDSLSIAASIDGDPISGWAVDGQIGKSQAAVFRFANPLVLDESKRLRISLAFQHPNARHAMGRIRCSVTARENAVPEVGLDEPPISVIEALQRLANQVQPSESDRDTIQSSPDWRLGLQWFQSSSKEWQSMSEKVSALQLAGPELDLTRVLVTSEGLPHLPHHADDRGYPHFYPELHLLRRGDVSQKVRVVQPGFPRVFDRKNTGETELVWTDTSQTKSTTSYRRAALATWMTDVDSGAGALVARVMVNRLWQHHFGKGIVATPNDFGASGQFPSHPELLDWLAQKLIASDWKLKPIHRAIMTSQTYMQGNKIDDDPRSAIDPENTWLWHRSPRRLEAEAIRDAMLTVSGLMDSTMFGPGTLDPNMKRRSVYFFIKRSQLIPTMMLFDWPEHLVSIGQRQSTTIAPQALMFMNSEQGRSYAEAFATKILSADLGSAIRQAYMQAIGRMPSDEEFMAADGFVKQATITRRAGGEGEPETAALADLCQIVFCLNEFIYID